MKYSKSNILYQDNPAFGIIIKLIFVMVPGVLLLGSIFYFSTGENTDATVLFFEAVLTGLIFRSVFPRSYQVYEDHLCIVLGWPFSFNIGFSEIKSIAITNKTTLSINFITKFAMNYVEIAKHRGFSVAITPRNYKDFVKYANEGFSRWVKESKQISD
ncbi:PH domain-containing protein [Chloroflexota bacterium]